MKAIEIFGKDTLEYKAFYKALEEMCPMVIDLYWVLMDSMDEDRSLYTWTMPSGKNIKTPVMVSVSKRVKIDELNTSFTHITKENHPDVCYRALLANITHSVDGWVLEEMEYRINFNPKKIAKLLRMLKVSKAKHEDVNPELLRMIQIATECEFVSGIFLDLIDYTNIGYLPDWIREKLITMCIQILKYPRSPISTVHDQIDSLAVSCNGVRFHYNEILAQVAESQIMEFILREVRQDPTFVYYKATDGIELAEYIRNCNYSLS